MVTGDSSKSKGKATGRGAKKGAAKGSSYLRAGTAGRSTARSAVSGRYRGSPSPASAGHSKISVSMPDDLQASVRERVGPGRVSAYVAAAVERQLELDRLAQLVGDFEARVGRPVSEELVAEAESVWHGA